MKTFLPILLFTMIACKQYVKTPDGKLASKVNPALSDMEYPAADFSRAKTERNAALEWKDKTVQIDLYFPGQDNGATDSITKNYPGVYTDIGFPKILSVSRSRSLFSSHLRERLLHVAFGGTALVTVKYH